MRNGKMGRYLFIGYGQYENDCQGNRRAGGRRRRLPRTGCADLSGYEVVALGYWLRLGQPDPLMLKYLPKVHDAQVVFFQTHGTAPTSEHAITSFARAGYNLGPGCTILGTFGCRGKINPAMLAKRKNAGPDDPHGGPKSMERWKLASTHPDAQDIADAKDLVDRMKHKMVMRDRFLAKKAAKMAALQQKKTDKD